jgi:hypothetical protein
MQSDVSVPNIYGTSSSTYLIIFLKVISKVLFFNITQKFTNLLVQLSIFLIYLFVGTYRLSSHARLEAFVIQTKLKTTCNQITTNIIQMRRDIEHNPHKYLSNTPSGVQGSESQPPDPHRQACLISVLRGGGALQYQSGSFSLINVGSGFHCLRSFFFLLFLCFRWDVVSLHPLSSAEYKTTSFPNPCR